MLKINIKFWTIDYVGGMKRIAKFGSDWFYGGFSPCGWNDTFTVFSTCFVDQAIDHNSQRILIYYGSKDFVWRKDVPLSIRRVKIESKEVNFPKSGSEWKSQPKRKRPKIPYNFVI